MSHCLITVHKGKFLYKLNQVCLIKETWKTCSVGWPPGTWLGTTDIVDFNGAPEFELPKCSLNAASKGSKRSQPRKKGLI